MHVKRRLSAPSPSFVISLIALFVALGGTTYAATSLPRNSVGSKQLRKGAVTPTKVAQKTIALFQGQTGPKGDPGPKGDTGAQGPGGTIVAYDATASASPTVKTLGTFLGDTLGASCSIPSSGAAELNVYFKTSNGAWNVDVIELDSSGGTVVPHVTRFNYPAGTFSTSTVFTQVLAASGGNQSDVQDDIVQLGPLSGSLTMHGSASTAGGTQTCHFAVQTFPEALTSITG